MTLEEYMILNSSLNDSGVTVLDRDRVSDENISALERSLALNPYSSDSGVVFDDYALIDDSCFDDRKKSTKSLDSSLLIGAASVGVGTYVLTQTHQSKAVTGQINTMVNDLGTIVTTIITLAISVLTVYYAFRIVGRLMP
ncbi:hypothetical protein [Spirulina sp. 06S082]|uniref:hypothetical protein n=1 Tax=Spirulina sp. 06S082 TaxID=3110248 RepID=UPI002B20F6F4|nr:hypothetical protein [Spirulina sp. 06S082]MEA5472157.1 hypothetical protein [Spirulina sp. 06S082]